MAQTARTRSQCSELGGSHHEEGASGAEWPAGLRRDRT